MKDSGAPAVRRSVKDKKKRRMAVLKNKTVVVTRGREQAGELMALLEEHGARVLHLPAVEIGPPDSWEACDAAIDKLADYHWIVFTSTNGVRYFLDRLQQRGGTLHRASAPRLAAVGERTAAALQECGVDVDLVPDEFRAEGLLRALAEYNLQGKRVLVPRGDKGREVLLEGLAGAGAEVDAVQVYRNRRPHRGAVAAELERLNGAAVDVLTFTSPSTVYNFLDLAGRERVNLWRESGCCMAAIGRVTAKALGRSHLPVDILPERSTIPDLVNAIVEHFS